MDSGLKRIAVLGSTGSIGQQTLEVARDFPDRLKIVGLAAGGNLGLLAQQVREFGPSLVSFGGEGLDLRRVPMEEMASHPDVDVVVVATSGKAGLAPTLAAIRAKKGVALANKEVLVMAGEVVMAEARRQGVEIMPIDSEHSALWQCLRGEENREVARLLLTASGGAFRDWPLGKLESVTPEEALRHPTWRMGRKVTIDSATLMNKGMEVIEARWLFGVPFNQIQVVMHRESIVHSLVEFVDGSVKAQMGPPDMRLPIQLSLSYPERWGNPTLPRLNLKEVGALSFGEVDLERYPCLRLALEAGRRGGTYPAVLSAADDVAVALFLQGRIGFQDIARVVEETVAKHVTVDRPNLDNILAADSWARAAASEWSKQPG
ncbi:MAG: 1-deoxy-D-xylulose-5-phosphate reductoisomerase [Chloroflexi bacterium]|nr:1-deoxy-D-xylulose-5-phosphate reductoisomerase [Chloroflexota bacterium]